MKFFRDLEGRMWNPMMVLHVWRRESGALQAKMLSEDIPIMIDEATFHDLKGETPATPDSAKRRPMIELTAADGWVLGTSYIPGPTGVYRCAVIALNTGGRLSLSLSSDSMALEDFAGWIPLPVAAK